MTQQNLTVGGTVLAVKSETLKRALLNIWCNNDNHHTHLRKSTKTGGVNEN